MIHKCRLRVKTPDKCSSLLNMIYISLFWAWPKTWDYDFILNLKRCLKHNKCTTENFVSFYFGNLFYFISFEVHILFYVLVKSEREREQKTHTIFTMINDWELRTSVFCVFLLTLIGLRDSNVKFARELIWLMDCSWFFSFLWVFQWIY